MSFPAMPAPGLTRAIGLMSGTSLDGIDAAVIDTDGLGRVVAGPAVTIAYDDAFRARLRGILGCAETSTEIEEVERELTDRHVAAIEGLLARSGVQGVSLIGFHGHTIFHRPHRGKSDGRTWQIGDAGRLAASLGLPVIADFRSADVAAGGEGAPLVPVFHQALAALLQKPLAVLNLGGVGNVTWIGEEDRLLAFDTGPGNAPIDDWALRHTGIPVDRDGALAAGGRPDPAHLGRFQAHPFFAAPPPKSLDRDDFRQFMPSGLSPADGAATLTAATAAAVALALAHLPVPPRRWLVTGGGRHNPVLMAELARRLNVPVEPVEAVGWQGDALEAQAFAYLAVRSRAGLPLSFPTTTGVAVPTCGGRSFQPPHSSKVS